MRDVSNGWLIRYLHSNTASAFFFLVYLHIGRGIYYGSYRSPITLVWAIGTVILIAMMASMWPNWIYINKIRYIIKNFYYKNFRSNLLQYQSCLRYCLKFT